VTDHRPRPVDVFHDECMARAEAEREARAAVRPPATDRTALMQRITKAVKGVLPMSSSLACEVVADAVLAVLPAVDRAAVCICGHTEAQHFEDVCITEITGCDCGDFLPPDAAREVIARWREAATRKPADRAAVLREAADGFDRHAEQILDGSDDKAAFVTKALREQAAVWQEAAETLRRMAADAPAVGGAQQPKEGRP